MTDRVYGPTIIINAIVLYMYNVSVDEIFSVAYGETDDFRHQDSYRDEKIDVIKRGGISALWGMLDSGGKDRLSRAAMDKYFDESYRAVAHNTAKAAEEMLPDGWRRDEDGTLHGDTGPLGTNEDVTDAWTRG